MKDAKKRLQKADASTGSATDDRRAALESKIEVINAERESKLLDVEQKYHLRIQLELVNFAVITMPKLDMTVEIRSRAATIKRTVTWNPLLHTIEPLLCEVCRRGGTKLHLCENGHLVHAECLAPQCVECKREYCQLCAKEVVECVVCARPICVHGLTRCKECQRATCSEHAGECHVLNGEPRKIIADREKPAEVESKAGKKKSAQVAPVAETKSARKEIQKSKLNPYRVVAPPKPLADYLEVYSDPAEGTIAAYMIRRKSELAESQWTMMEKGIAISCICEKTDCRENNLVYMPWLDLDEQLEDLLNRFRNEYHLPHNKTRYFQIRFGKPFEEKKLKIPATWRDEAMLEKARKGFEELSKRNSN